MNDINGVVLYNKIKELIPGIPTVITPTALEKLCEDNSVRPFLKWFHNNLNEHIILPDECTQLKKHIQENSTWLSGEQLDLALAEATKDCPDLLKLLETTYWNGDQAENDYKTEKELYDADLEYLNSIQGSLDKLKKWEERMDNQLELEDEASKKEEIKLKLVYDKCTSVLDDFHSCHQELFRDVELLSDTYTAAIQKKGEICLWTQMPIELYIKQLETYSDYLNSYAKRQFAKIQSNGDQMSDHSDYLSNSNDNDKFEELIACQRNLFSSKRREIISKAENEANKGLVNCAIEIYNNGELKAPSTPVLARAEIAELTKTRDFLEETVNSLQEKYLVDVVHQFSKAKVVKFLEKEAETRLERRKNKLSRLEQLCTLAEEHGLAFSTILCMLFELQIHRIHEIIQFVMDARHYLCMEYSLSSVRNESMQKLQEEYTSLLASFKDQNAFCRLFQEMVALDEPKSDLHESIYHYDGLKRDNENTLNILLKENLESMMEKAKFLDEQVEGLFNQEISNSPTFNFAAVPCEILNEISKTSKNVEDLEKNVELIRNKLKSMIRETNTPSFEREKLLLWQKFLADPKSLRDRYEKLEELRNRAGSL